MAISLTEKERLLLEDQKRHEELCIEKYSNYAKLAKDRQLKEICTVNGEVERKHLDSINELLSGNLPDMNQQKSQSSGTKATSEQVAGINLSDKDICSDLLMTEKYVSGAYDKAIFEFKDTGVRDVLNHIQKEEQKHGEAVFQYMENKGMYIG